MTTYQLIKQEGFKEGIEKGIEEKAIEVVMNSWKNGISIEMICNITGLSKKEIEKIIDKNK